VKELTRFRAARSLLSNLRGNEEGQGFAEYALILVLIAILSIIALFIIGNQMSSELSTIGNSV
jgi:Flp pilus assembly pilin Flp